MDEGWLLDGGGFYTDLHGQARTNTDLVDYMDVDGLL